MHAEFGTLTVDGVTAPFSCSPPLPDTELVLTVTGDDLVIRTGVNMGPVQVDYERCPFAPDSEDEGAWDDTVEVSGFTISGVPVSVHGPTEMPPDSIADPGVPEGRAVTLRIHAAGRREAFDLAVDEPTERYLIQVWKTPDDAVPRDVSPSKMWNAVSPDVISEALPRSL